MKTSKLKSKKGIALILTLGIIFMLGIMAGSFAFYSSMSSKNTDSYMHSLQAYNTANSGYHHMVGAVNEFLDIVMEESIISLNSGLTTAEIAQIKAGNYSSSYVRVNNDQFNQLRSYLTTFLNGNTVDFTESEVVKGIDNNVGAGGLAETLNNKIFNDDKSWAKRYGLFKEGNIAGDSVKYDIDLDGINNYLDSGDTDYNIEIAKSLLAENLDESIANNNVKSIAEFGTPEVIAFEQKDANWKFVEDENSKKIAMFAVMAKDQSSLININGSMNKEAVGDIANADEFDDSTLDSADIAEGLTNLSSDITNIEEVLNNAQTTASFTSSSINASKHLDINTSDITTLFKYLNEETSDNEVKKSNAKVSCNILDYTDEDNFPTLLTKSSIEDASAWTFKNDDEIFAGIEGVKISEVNPSPEQVFSFGSDDANPLSVTVKVLDKGKIDSEDYFYASSVEAPANNVIKEEFYDSTGKEESMSSDSDNNESYLRVAKPIEIRNPGGAYQVWLKMKITAKNEKAGAKKKVKFDALDKDVNGDVLEPDIVVEWKEGQTDQTQVEVAKESLVTEVSKKIWDNVDVLVQGDFTEITGKPGRYAYTPGGLFLNDLVEGQLPAGFVENDDSILISGDVASDFNKIKNEDANYYVKDINGDPVQKAATFTWDEMQGKADTIEKARECLTESATLDTTATDPDAAKLEELSQYSFGSKVIEVAIFDKGAKEGGGDELIGMFYCVNTNNFSEDDKYIKAIPSEWKESDNDYIWFYSVGIPEWMANSEGAGGSEERCNRGFPEWMKAQIASDENILEKKSVLTDLSKDTYNSNLCVFPREDCNLEFRFRLVDMSNPRFNGGDKDKQNYRLGIGGLVVDTIAYDDNDPYKEKGLIDTVNSTIVSRPQWSKDDEVKIEIKEMVLTQQVYDTSTYQKVVTDAVADAQGSDAQILLPKTYNKLDGVFVKEEQLKTEPIYIKNTNLTDMIYYRNQRLEKENRAANELGAGEYIEIFNGTGNPVNVDGWILKIEQYDENGNLLGPRKPNDFIDISEGSYDGVSGDLQVSYSNRVGDTDYDARADYILLSDTIIPAFNVDSKIASKLPYVLISNSLNGFPNIDNESEVYISHTNSFNPLFFKNSSNIALGDLTMTSNIMSETESGRMFYKDPDGSPNDTDGGNCIKEEKVGSIRSLSVSKVGLDIDGDKIRVDPLGSGSSATVPWYEKKNDKFGEYHEYETFNLVAGKLKSDGTPTESLTITIDEKYNNENKMDTAVEKWEKYDKDHGEKNVTIEIDEDEYALKITIEEDIAYCNTYEIVSDNTDSFHPATNFNIREIAVLIDGDHERYTSICFTDQGGKKSNPFNSLGDDFLSQKEFFQNVLDKGLEDGLIDQSLAEDFAKVILFPADDTGSWKYDCLTSTQKDSLFPLIFGDSQTAELIFIQSGDINYPSTFEAPDYDGNPSTDLSEKQIAYYGNFSNNPVLLVLKSFNNFGKLKTFMKDENICENIISNDECNFTPNDSLDSGGNNFLDLQCAFVPILFNASRRTDEEIAEENVIEKKTSFNINLGTTDKLNPNDTVLAKTFNIPKEGLFSFSNTDIVSDDSKVTKIRQSIECFNSNVAGAQPLHFRDDAERLVITLMAPVNSNKAIQVEDIVDSNSGLISGGKNKMFSELATPELYGTGIDYNIVDCSEWLCSKESEDAIGTRYAVVDRAVIDRGAGGGTSMELNNFFTDTLAVRSRDKDTMTKVAGYWESHDEVYKSHTGPIGDKWAIKSYSSPGYPNFGVDEAKDLVSSDTDPNENDITIPLHPTVDGESVSREEYVRSKEEELGGNDVDHLYEYNHAGHGNFNDNFFSFVNNQCFIKDAPLASIAELCDVPSPSCDAEETDNATLDPLAAESLKNAIIDGLEGDNTKSASNYLSVTQKKKIFSGTSADTNEIIPANITNFGFSTDITTDNPLGQYGANPEVVKKDVSQPLGRENFTLKYTFNCTGDKTKYFYPGRYRIYIEGLNYEFKDGTIFDLFSSIILLPDSSVIDEDGKVISEDTYIAKGGAFIGGSSTPLISAQVGDPAEPLREDHLVQLFPLSGGEYFNVQEKMEVNFFVNFVSSYLQNNLAVSATVEEFQSFLDKVSSSEGFNCIKFLLVPEESSGKVNINTAPPQTLFRLPGFKDAINPAANSDEEKLRTFAAAEVVEDIIRYKENEDGLIFTDAGDFLTAKNLYNNGLRAGKRIFPVTGNDVALSDDGKKNLAESGLEKGIFKEMVAREKLNIFREVLPHLQFDSSSLKIISVGRSLKPVGDSFIVKASQKITVDLNLNEKIGNLRDLWVEDVDSLAVDFEKAVKSKDEKKEKKKKKKKKKHWWE